MKKMVLKCKLSGEGESSVIKGLGDQTEELFSKTFISERSF